MAEVQAKKPATLDDVMNAVGNIASKQSNLEKEIGEIKEKAAAPVFPSGFNPAHVFHATSGPVGRDSAGYSILKAAGLSMGILPAEQCKEEVAISNKLREIYVKKGYEPHRANSIIVPHSSRDLPPDAQEFGAEIRQKMAASAGNGPDPDEIAWMARKGYIQKTMGTTNDTLGGTLIGYATLGELVDLQRNREVFSRAGASQVTLPANARMAFPKQTGGCTAYWVGEGAAITASDAATGILDLVGKKLGVLVKLNNELIRYASPTSEAMIRNDIARQSALKADAAMIDGTGGTQIKGLLTYPSASSWTQGQDSLLTYSVTSNTLQPQDAVGMVGILPDEVQDQDDIKFVMRNDLWAKVAGRRADAVSGSDGKGPFVYNITRGIQERLQKQFGGYEVIGSSQTPYNRGGSSNQTCVFGGYFPDWIIARFGVMEFLASNTGDTALTNDQTWLRGIQILDAGPRHAASFVLADAITVQ
jgi:HK97 family phage major capsid protein